MAEIDRLEVKIQANAQSATASLKSLASALQRVKTALTGMKDGVSVSDHLAKSLNEMNGALNTVTTSGIKKLQKLANALDGYASAVKKVKAMGGINGNTSVKNKAPWKSSVVEMEYTSKDFADIERTEKREQLERYKDALQKAKDKLAKFKEEQKKAAEETEKASKKIKKATGFMNKFVKSIGRIMLYRAIRSALKGIGEAFETGLKNAYYYSQQTGDLTKLAETLDRVKSVTSQMVNQLGAFWGEIKQFVAPALEWISNKIREISEYLTELFAAINGDTYYQRAKLVSTSWDDAADSVKKYKHQLLGLDELNNLSANNDNGKASDFAKAKEEFEDVLVSDKMKEIGSSISSLLQKLRGILKEVKDFLEEPISQLVIGAVLAFMTPHTLIGIGLMAAGAIRLYNQSESTSDSLYETIKGYFKKYRKLITAVAVGMAAIGTILLFVPTKQLIGLSMILASGVLMAANISFNWTELYDDLKTAFKKYRKLITAVAVGMAAIGIILLFIPSMKVVGIAMIIESGVLMAANVAFNWTELKDDCKAAFKKYRKLITAVAVGMAAIGIILLFVPSMKLVGISMIVASGVLMAANIAFNWTELKDDCKKAFKKYKKLITAVAVGMAAIGVILLFIPSMKLVGISMIIASGVLMAATVALNWDELYGKVQETFQKFAPFFAAIGLGSMVLGILLLFTGHIGLGLGLLIGGGFLTAETIAFNWDSILEGLQGAWEKIKTWWNTTVVVKAKNAIEDLESSLHYDFNGDGTIGGISTTHISGSGSTHGGTSGKFATGGIPQSGSLFYAGEQGAEFVGNIGNTSAVANTGQMTDAIYKAAYMGMSRALQENGGNGLAGFVPASMDDLFIAMKKKASNYNKMTGSPAFG